MARSLSSPTNSAVTSTTTAPAYLIQISWTIVTRITTGNPITWNSVPWAAAGATVRDLEWKNAGMLAATLTLFNPGQEFSALAFNEGVADVPISVWAYDQTATATGDPVKVFDGVGGRLSADDGRVVIELLKFKSKTLRSPRLRITRENGFSILPARGTSIRVGTQRFTLEPR